MPENYVYGISHYIELDITPETKAKKISTRAFFTQKEYPCMVLSKNSVI